jgi:hypothetical protein
MADKDEVGEKLHKGESRLNAAERTMRNARGEPLRGKFGTMDVDPKTGAYIDKPPYELKERISKATAEKPYELIERVSRGGGGGGGGRASSMGGAGSLLHDMNPQKLYKKGGNVKRMADGGMTSTPPTPLPGKPSQTKEKPPAMPSSKPQSDRKLGEGATKYAKGGSASSRADGIAQRGKTRGTMVMCGGGMARGKK